MKKIFNVLLLVFVSILFYSCQTSPENKGKIVVTNQAENETDVIIAVYAKPRVKIHIHCTGAVQTVPAICRMLIFT